MIHEYSPIEIGLDALRVEPGVDPIVAFQIGGQTQAFQIQVVNERIEQAMIAYPEIKTEILVAGMKILVDVSHCVEHFREAVLPLLDRSVDTVAA